MKKLVLLATMISGFALTTAAPVMAMGGRHFVAANGHSAPAADIGSGLLGNAAAFAGLSVALMVLVRRRSRR